MIICRNMMIIYVQLDIIYLEVETERGSARWKENGNLDDWVKESAELINILIKVTQIQSSDANSFENIISTTYIYTTKIFIIPAIQMKAMIAVTCFSINSMTLFWLPVTAHLRVAMVAMVAMDTVVEVARPAPAATSHQRSVRMTWSRPALTASAANWNWWKRSEVRKCPGPRSRVRKRPVTVAETSGPDTASMRSAQARLICSLW